MKFLKKIFENRIVSKNGKVNITDMGLEENFAEAIKDPTKISSKMVRKIVLNGLHRLEKEGADPFGESNDPTPQK